MIQFVLNDKLIHTEAKAGSTLLDFVRYQQQLKGTKIGCREGDCGACTLLVGELVEDKIQYKSVTSCISPLGNAHAKHIVSIEGLNMEKLSPFQQAMVDESGQQCGFCTVGFIVSFAGECLQARSSDYDSIISAIDGNICRCTGYKSIERASEIIAEKLSPKDLDHPVSWLIKNNFIPSYFEEVPEMLQKIKVSGSFTSGKILGGGTDLLVQQHDEIHDSEVKLASQNINPNPIREDDNYIQIDGNCNTTQLLESEILQKAFPKLKKHLKLVSSTPIRNMASVAGNLINASPIGDLTIFFLALDTELVLMDSNKQKRSIKLRDLYKGYKLLDKTEDEMVSSIRFKNPIGQTHFNFEKVSKRRYLDIASVNSAMSVRLEGDKISEIHISAGGVGPIPMYLLKTCSFLLEKKINEEILVQASEILATEISPISDARGSKEYKSLLLRQLFYAHFMELFPSLIKMNALI